MNDDAEQQPLAVATSYPESLLAQAFVTALTHEEAGTRQRAEVRGQRWREVLAAMTAGRVTVGSRTPVTGIPAWVTPKVMRGGFSTGAVSAGGPLQAHETDAARSFGVPAERRALFAYCLTEPGLAWLWALLDSGGYEIGVPEEAALLTVAWLVRHGASGAAADLVAELEPLAGRLRFLPRPADAPASAAGAAVHRRTVSDAVGTLVRRRPNAAVEAQREALAVWQPFGDELLVHWLRTARAGQALEVAPDADWLARCEALLGRYRVLAAQHTLCSKHRKPKENLGILRGALEEVVAGRPLEVRRLGLLRHAVRSMVRRRGLPGSDAHGALRRGQADQAARPSHYALSQLILGRLAVLPQDGGITDVTALLDDRTALDAVIPAIPCATCPRCRCSARNRAAAAHHTRPSAAAPVTAFVRVRRVYGEVDVRVRPGRAEHVVRGPRSARCVVGRGGTRAAGAAAVRR